MSVLPHAWIPRSFWLPVLAIIPSLASSLAWTENYAQQRMAAIEYVRKGEGEIRFAPLPQWWPGRIPMPEWMQTVQFIKAPREPRFTLSLITPLHELWGLSIWCEADEEGLSSLPRFRHLKRIMFHNQKLSNADLVHVGKCRELELISMWKPGITNAGLRSLAGLPLTELSIEDSWIGDEGVRHLAGMPLRALTLRKTFVTDNGVQHLAGLPLHELDLEGTWITDARLEVLSQLPLERLNLSHTGVTPNGLPKLLESRTLRVIYVESRWFNHNKLKELQAAGLPVRQRLSKH